MAYITGTFTTTQTLAANSTTVTSNGTIDVNSTAVNIAAIFGPSGSAWTLANLGTVESIGNQGIGIDLESPGFITNGASGSAGALIEGSYIGIKIGTGIGTVVNFGTIQSGGITAGSGVRLAGGGSLTNQAGGLITASRYAVEILGAPATIANFGRIESTGTKPAIYSRVGGSITNSAGATIESARNGISFNDTVGSTASFGSVANAGTIISTASGNSGPGVYFGQGGALTNQAGGLIKASRSAVGVKTAAGTIVNSGTLQSTTLNGIYFQMGGTVTNLVDGLILSVNDGVHVLGAAGTVFNSGTIVHVGITGGEGVYLGAGGSVTNYGLISGSRIGSTTAGYPGAIAALNKPATVHNLGTISNPNDSDGVNLLAGGLLVNGSTSATSAMINAPHNAIYIGGTLGIPTSGAAGVVLNYGTVQNTSTANPAVRLVSGGSVINRGLISGAGTAISFGFMAGNVDNFGTVISMPPSSFIAGSGVFLESGGLITNEVGGLVAAQRYAISLAGNQTTGAAATITNLGTLSSNVGVLIGTSDTASNTIVNFGSIIGTGGIAIRLGAGDDQIVIEAGSVLEGAVSNFHPGDTFDLPFLPFSDAGTATIVSDGTISQKLQLVENGAAFAIELDPLQDFTQASFRLASDGKSGTQISEVVGSQLAFFGGGVSASKINVVLTPDGTNVPAPISGEFNIEMFTSTPPSPLLARAFGYQAIAFIRGAVLVSNNVVEAGPGAIEELIAGNFLMVDQTGHQSITIGRGGSISVAGSGGDTITGLSSDTGPGDMLIDASGTNGEVNPGPMTIVGGDGPTTVWGGIGDSITGDPTFNFGMTVDGTRGRNTISGGGSNAVTVGGGGFVVTGATVSGAAGDSITGAQGNNSASYITAGVKDTIIGGGGNTTVAGNLGSADLITGGAGAMTVYGSVNDLITGTAGAMQVNDATFAGGETVVGGAASLTVFSIGKNFSITGSTAATTFINDSYGKGGNSTITGGSGTVTGAGGLAVNSVIIGAAGDVIAGSSGTTYIDGILGSQAIAAGSGATTVQAAAGDTIAGGKGTLQVYLDSDQATTTINLGGGHGAASLREVSVAGGKGSGVSVTGFATASDIIQSSTSVQTGRFLGSSASDGKGGTILSFLDGMTMTLAGVGDPTKIGFAS